MHKHLMSKRFAPALECLEDRRVLSLLGSPVELPLVGAGANPSNGLLNLQLEVKLETPVLGLNLNAGVNALSTSPTGQVSLLDLDLGARVDAPILPPITVDTGVGVGSDIGADVGVGIGNDTGVGVGVDVGTDTGIDIGIETPIPGATTPPQPGPQSPGANPTPNTDGGLTAIPPADAQFTPATLNALPVLLANNLAVLDTDDVNSFVEPQLASPSTVNTSPAELPIAGYLAEVGLQPDEQAVAVELASETTEPFAAFEIDGLSAIELLPQDEGILDPSGLAAAELAVQQVLNTVSEATRAFLSWFAMLGPTPWILMGLAALASFSEVMRLRLEEMQRKNRFTQSW